MSNGLLGSIFSADISDKRELNVEDIINKFHEGQILKARVKKIDFVNFKVDLTIRPSDMKTSPYHLPYLIENWEIIDKTFKLSSVLILDYFKINYLIFI